MLSHVLCQHSQPNTRKVVDREPRVLRVVRREESLPALLQAGLLEPLCQRLQPQLLL